VSERITVSDAPKDPSDKSTVNAKLASLEGDIESISSHEFFPGLFPAGIKI